MNGKRAIKNNERNYPVKKSIRIVKEKRAAMTYTEMSAAASDRDEAQEEQAQEDHHNIQY